MSLPCSGRSLLTLDHPCVEQCEVTQLMITFFLSDEVMLHGEKGSVRDPGDAVSMGHSGSGIVNGPSSGPLNILGVKVRSISKACIASLTFFYL